MVDKIKKTTEDNISKNYFNEQLSENQITISPSSKLWENARTYEKRLDSIISKDKSEFSISILLKGDTY